MLAAPLGCAGGVRVNLKTESELAGFGASAAEGFAAKDGADVIGAEAGCTGVGAGLAVAPKLNFGAVVALVPDELEALSACFTSGAPNEKEGEAPAPGAPKALFVPCALKPPTLPNRLLVCCGPEGFCPPNGEGAEDEDGCPLSFCAAPLMLNAEPSLGAGAVVEGIFGGNMFVGGVIALGPGFVPVSAGFAKKLGTAGVGGFWLVEFSLVAGGWALVVNADGEKAEGAGPELFCLGA